MLGTERVASQKIREELTKLVAELGQYAVISYAQRAVGTKETGTLSPADCVQINSCNPDNFLRRLSNMINAHRKIQTAAASKQPEHPASTSVQQKG